MDSYVIFAPKKLDFNSTVCSDHADSWVEVFDVYPETSQNDVWDIPEPLSNHPIEEILSSFLHFRLVCLILDTLSSS